MKLAHRRPFVPVLLAVPVGLLQLNLRLLCLESLEVLGGLEYPVLLDLLELPARLDHLEDLELPVVHLMVLGGLEYPEDLGVLVRQYRRLHQLVLAPPVGQPRLNLHRLLLLRLGLLVVPAGPVRLNLRPWGPEDQLRGLLPYPALLEFDHQKKNPVELPNPPIVLLVLRQPYLICNFR